MATAVIEYEYRGYDPPPDLLAYDIQASISHAAGLAIATGKRWLAEIRTELEEAGLARAGIAKAAKAGGRYLPIWRETWRTPEQAFDELSPRAQKAKHQAAGRQRGYNPTLARTSTRLILQRPTRGGRGYQNDFAGWVGRTLPAFRFDPKRNRWEAELSEANYEAVMAADTELNISDGAKAWYVEQGENRRKAKEEEMEKESRLLELARQAEAKHPEFSSRAINAAEIVRAGLITHQGSSRFVVKSQSDNSEYQVDTERRSCTCADYRGLYKHKAPTINGSPLCKHRLAVLMLLKLQAPDPARIRQQQRQLDATTAAQRAGALLI